MVELKLGCIQLDFEKCMFISSVDIDDFIPGWKGDTLRIQVCPKKGITPTFLF